MCSGVRRRTRAGGGGAHARHAGGREGYASILNTDVKRELDHAAAFFKMAVAHKARRARARIPRWGQGAPAQAAIGAKFQLLIEPKPREPMKHQYDYDAQTVMGFLDHYGLARDFKLNIEPNHTTLAGHSFYHDICVASQYGGWLGRRRRAGVGSLNTARRHAGFDRRKHGR